MDVSEDIDCVADRVMKIMEFVDKMKQTTAEAQLTSLLNARPLPSKFYKLENTCLYMFICIYVNLYIYVFRSITFYIHI